MTNKPIKTFKMGSIRAAVWKHEGEKSSYFTVSISKLYKDENDQWKDGHSYFRDDLPLIAAVSDEAYRFIYSQPATVEAEAADEIAF